MLLLQGHGGLLGEGSPQVVPGAVHLDTAEHGSRDMLCCRSGMASRIGKSNTGHRELVLGTAFSAFSFLCLFFSLAQLFLSPFLSAVSLASLA